MNLPTLWFFVLCTVKFRIICYGTKIHSKSKSLCTVWNTSFALISIISSRFNNLFAVPLKWKTNYFENSNYFKHNNRSKKKKSNLCHQQKDWRRRNRYFCCYDHFKWIIILCALDSSLVSDKTNWIEVIIPSAHNRQR